MVVDDAGDLGNSAFCKPIEISHVCPIVDL